MRRSEVRKTDNSKLGRIKLNTKGAKPKVVAEVVKPVVAAKPTPEKKSNFRKD
jgi:hypothetical protein